MKSSKVRVRGHTEGDLREEACRRISIKINPRSSENPRLKIRALESTCLTLKLKSTQYTLYGLR